MVAITGQGWELLVTRLGIQKDGAKKRTYGTYQAYRDGQPIAGLAGNMCECVGPGDNVHAGSGRRIAEGRYPLWTQFGKYRTIGYSTDTHTPGASPMPGVRLEGTGNRTGILIHPGHPPKLYLSSIGCLNPTDALTNDQTMNFWDSRTRVIALIDSLRNFAPNAFQHETMTRIPGASVVVDGEPANLLQDAVNMVTAAAMNEAVAETIEPASLPISKAAALVCARWMLDQFGDQLRKAVVGKPYKVKDLCAIVCQETAYKWLKWVKTSNAKTIVERSVFDASGDYPGTTRSAFPKNTAVFRAKYGDQFTDMLIEEANLTRRMQGWGDKNWVYKGYGIFQYDLQHVKKNPDFFKERKWYSFEECLARCCDELDEKLGETNGDLWQAIKRYNGSGSKAEQYMQNVRVFSKYCSEVVPE
jgi:hypothetical protein